MAGGSWGAGNLAVGEWRDKDVGVRARATRMVGAVVSVT